MVLLMWGMFALSSGMPYETLFPFMSETSSVLRGFLYQDPTRPFTSTFYHLSYLLGEALGVTGSFVPYQVVYALLWWARGFLVFLILRRALPRFMPLAYVIGALTLVHASDGALQWIGQLNQFGFIFWMMLGFYLLVRALDAGGWIGAAGFGLLAAACEYMSLWSYESGVFLILFTPAAIMLLRYPVSKHFKAVLVAWYVVLGFYLRVSILKYFYSGGPTYQESVMRGHWSVWSLVSDLGFNIFHSLCFWQWRGTLPDIVPAKEAALLGLAAVAVYLAGILALKGLPWRGGERTASEARAWRPLLVLLLAGALWVVLSFPAYLLLDAARGLWRTQFLSGPGAAAVLAAGAALIFRALPYRRLRAAAVVAAGAVITYYGAVCALQRGAYHRALWESHRRAVAALLRTVPAVEPGTVIVLTNVPRTEDPFHHDMWFDAALRLAYPGTPVAGIYYLSDGSPAPGNNLTLTDGKWRWNQTTIAPLVTLASSDQMIVLDYSAHDVLRLAEEIPGFVCADSCRPETYAPRQRIAGSEPDPRAVRRYGPL